MNKYIIGAMLGGLGVGIAIGAVVQEVRIRKLIEINEILSEAYIRTNIAAALELHRDDWAFSEEEKTIIRRAGFEI